jgi:hypothetical protein
VTKNLAYQSLLAFITQTKKEEKKIQP